jgi:GntR family transcriptional regulator/MocR family aminotransferase
MKDLLLVLPADSRPVYVRIADALRTAIMQERLPATSRLPSSRQLATLLGVHKHTVMAAMDELVAEGWLEAHQRSSYRVHRSPPKQLRAQRQLVRSDALDVKEFSWAQRQSVEIFSNADYFLYKNQGIKHRFISDGPDLRLVPLDEIRDALRRAGSSPAAETFGYGGPQGVPALLESIETYLQRMRAIQGRRIIVTNGSTEAILMVALLLLGPGKRVVMDRLCFRPISELFALTHTEVCSVPMDADGTDPDALDAVLRHRGADLIYLTPLHHYPTTSTMPPERRALIYRIAAQYGVPILEDDYDHEFHYSGTPLAPMASDDPLGLVIYASTFSKSAFPGARIGFLAIPDALLLPLCKVRRCTTWQVNGLAQQAMAIWVNGGGFERHIARARCTYQRRLTHMLVFNCVS